MRSVLAVFLVVCSVAIAQERPGQGERKALVQVPFGEQRIDLGFARALYEMSSEQGIAALAKRGHRVLVFDQDKSVVPYAGTKIALKELEAFQKTIPTWQWAKGANSTAVAFFEGQGISLDESAAVQCSANTFIVKPNARPSRLVREWLAVALSEAAPPKIAGIGFPSKADASRAEVKALIEARGKPNRKEAAELENQGDLRKLLEAFQDMNVFFMMYENEIGGKKLGYIIDLRVPLARLLQRVQARDTLRPQYNWLVKQWHEEARRVLTDAEMETFSTDPHVRKILDSIPDEK